MSHPLAAAPPNGGVQLWARRLIEGWALLGGALLLAVTALEALNAGSKLVTGAAHAAEHELVKYMIGIAIFTFLPYCQLKRGHIAVDIFTQKLPQRGRLALEGVGTLLGLAIAALLIKQMTAGMMSYYDYREVTPILKLPLWTAFPVVLVSLGLWVLACLCTLQDLWRERRAI